MSQAWVTLATNDDEAIGALVLAESLRDVSSSRKLHVMFTSGVSEAIKKCMLGPSIGCDIGYVDPLKNSASSQRPDLAAVFAKFQCWRLVQYKKCVFVCADCVATQNCDELFDYAEFSAAPDIGWPDMFNTGVFVFSPSFDTYNRLIEYANSHGSFNGGDQGVLNDFFVNWKHSKHSRLPFTYNASSSPSYTYISAFKRFSQDIKIVHFLGPSKPWHCKYNCLTGQVTDPNGTGLDSDHVKLWWSIFSRRIVTFLFDIPEQPAAAFPGEKFAITQPPASYFYHPPIAHRVPEDGQKTRPTTSEKVAQFFGTQPPPTSTRISQDNQAPEVSQQPSPKVPFVASVLFNVEPPGYLTTGEGRAPDFGGQELTEDVLAPPQVPYVWQPWQPPTLPSFAGELSAVDRTYEILAPPLWPPALARVARLMDEDQRRLLADLVRQLPNDLLNRPLQDVTHYPCALYSNRLSQCPVCGESFDYLNDYFPVDGLQSAPITVDTEKEESNLEEKEEIFDYEDYEHRLAWEQGLVDYKGRDSWQNVMEYMIRNLK